MLYCSKCGNQMNDQDMFCNKCGTPVKSPAPAQETAANSETNNLNNSLIESLKAKIATGDCVAMYELGLYYESLDDSILIGDSHPLKLAIEYFDQAEKAGHVGAVLKVCEYKQKLAELKEEAYGVAKEDVIIEKAAWIQMCSRGIELLQNNAPGSELIKMSDFRDSLDKARYSYAYSLYSAKEPDKALQLVSNYDDIPSRVLEAMIIDERLDAKIHECCGNIEACSEEYLNDIIQQKRDIITRMSVILNNDQYGLKSKTAFEEFAYVNITISLSNYYKSALGNDRAKSISILKYVRQFLKKEIMADMIDKELSHYIVLGSGKIVYKNADGSIE